MSAIKTSTALIISVTTPINEGLLFAPGVFVVDTKLREERGPTTRLLNDWCYHKEQIANIHLLAIPHIYPSYAIALARIVDFPL